METNQNVFHESKQSKRKIQSRIDRINLITSKFHEHLAFKDSVNFNFLFSLYSQKLKELYNSMELYDEKDFNERVELLENSIKRIKPFMID